LIYRLIVRDELAVRYR